MTATDNSSSISQEFGRKHLVNDAISTIILIALISPCLNVPSAICARIYLASLTSAAQVRDQWPDEHFLLCTSINSDCTLELSSLRGTIFPLGKERILNLLSGAKAWLLLPQRRRSSQARDLLIFLLCPLSYLSSLWEFFSFLLPAPASALASSNRSHLFNTTAASLQSVTQTSSDFFWWLWLPKTRGALRRSTQADKQQHFLNLVKGDFINYIGKGKLLEGRVLFAWWRWEEQGSPPTGHVSPWRETLRQWWRWWCGGSQLKGGIKIIFASSCKSIWKQKHLGSFAAATADEALLSCYHILLTKKNIWVKGIWIAMNTSIQANFLWPIFYDQFTSSMNAEHFTNEWFTYLPLCPSTSFLHQHLLLPRIGVFQKALNIHGQN